MTEHVNPLGWHAVVLARQRAGARRGDQVVLDHDVPGGELGGGRVHGGDVRTLDDDPALGHGADVGARSTGVNAGPPAPLASPGAGLDGAACGGVIGGSLPVTDSPCLRGGQALGPIEATVTRGSPPTRG